MLNNGSWSIVRRFKPHKELKIGIQRKYSGNVRLFLYEDGKKVLRNALETLISFILIVTRTGSRLEFAKNKILGTYSIFCSVFYVVPPSVFHDAPTLCQNGLISQDMVYSIWRTTYYVVHAPCVHPVK